MNKVAKKPVVALRIDLRWTPNHLGPTHLGLSVRCDWCGVRYGSGCLVCGRLRECYWEIQFWPEWGAFQRSVRDDPAAVLGMAADWLRERGFEPLEVSAREE